MAHMKKTQYGKVDLDYVLGIGGFDLERFVSPLYLLKVSSALFCFSVFLVICDMFSLFATMQY